MESTGESKGKIWTTLITYSHSSEGASSKKRDSLSPSRSHPPKEKSRSPTPFNQEQYNELQQEISMLKKEIENLKAKEVDHTKQKHAVEAKIVEQKKELSELNEVYDQDTKLLSAWGMVGNSVAKASAFKEALVTAGFEEILTILMQSELEIFSAQLATKLTESHSK